ncbi:hypothetical protein [[Clostridium] aminophilum]|uniref:Uncharacterized protein n=1 Tax=[Clostridium] aminophilum TaxID=1526 RepID=A0A1I6IN15_9FIRM|nr:hypothetical protein [[Clostridium] aminophilum]MCR4629952.1 hypothetical protein [Clostridium sp.]SFR68123.1 hypothetical protein SAMN02910262_00593 [[Clostridium] aminophilum]
MRMYDKLFLGPKAAKHRFTVLQRIRHQKWVDGLYVLVPSSNPGNIMDILPAAALSEKHGIYRDALIIGAAKGYDEACELAGSIVAAMYRDHGNFNLEAFL